MKKLLYTTTAFVLCGGIVQANADCISTPSCTAMGYTETSSCDGGLKCPFGSYWYCPSNSGGECADFPYLCIGRGYVDGGGIGADCNGKYAKCECYEGFEWQDGKGCLESSTECKIGTILYSDMTCSSSGYDNDKGLKTAIGVVVYIGSDGKKWAIAPKSIGSYYWADVLEDIPSLTNYSSAADASKDYDSCGNTEKMLAQGNKDKYPSAWAAHEYSTEGTSAGDWCLPAAGILTSYFNNKNVINLGLTRASGTKLETGTWASTEYDRSSAWRAKDTTYGLSHDNGKGGNGYSNYYVRPVLEFPVEEKPACDSSYQYTCTGANESPSGEACDGKYTACTCASGYYWSDGRCVSHCSSPYIWNGSSCICSSSYQFSCSGSYQKPVGASCNGKYTRCSCSNNKSFCMNSNGQFDCLTENSSNCYAD